MTYRPRPVSGFPEHLPEIRMAELHMLDRIRAVFESYGFASIETPSVEELEVLLAKGETDKEIYTIVGGLSGDIVADAIFNVADIRTSSASELRRLTGELGVDREEFVQGVAELCSIMEHLNFLGIKNVVADLSIARGFDYYTG